MKNELVDDIDFKIINIIKNNSKTTYAEIAKMINVSAGTVHIRVKRLEEIGVILGYRTEIDYKKLNYDITAFLGIYLQKSSSYASVAKELKKIPEVVDIYYTTGLYSMFIRIICKDTEHLRSVLMDKIQTIEEITRTETFISLHESFSRSLQFE